MAILLSRVRVSVSGAFRADACDQSNSHRLQSCLRNLLFSSLAKQKLRVEKRYNND